MAARAKGSAIWSEQDFNTLIEVVVKPVRRACTRGAKFGQDASRRARAVRAKCSLAGLTIEVETSGVTTSSANLLARRLIALLGRACTTHSVA